MGAADNLPAPPRHSDRTVLPVLLRPGAAALIQRPAGGKRGAKEFFLLVLKSTGGIPPAMARPRCRCRQRYPQEQGRDVGTGVVSEIGFSRSSCSFFSKQSWSQGSSSQAQSHPEGSVRSTGLGPSGARCARALPGARSCVAAEAKVEQVAIE